MNIIVTGGAGFIGSNLIDRLMKNPDNKVLCIDNLSTGSMNNIEQYLDNPNFRFFKKNIADFIYDNDYSLYHEISDFFNDEVDEIYNFACPASPEKYQKYPIHTIRTSIVVDYLCDVAYDFNAKILHASTSEVYGEPTVSPQPETYRGNVNTVGPRSCYDEGKRVAETIMYEYYKMGCNCKLIRIFNTYGPKMDPKDGRVVSNFINQCLEGNDVTVYGDGSQTRSFQYIDDLLDVIELLMKTDYEVFGPFNIGNPEEFTIMELAEKVIEKTHSASKIDFKALPGDDPTNRRPDITKAKERLSWSPKINLDEGLDKTIEYFKNYAKN